MKLFSIFMLVFTLGGFASGYSQKQVVTLNLKQCDVNTLLQEIWKQTGLRFVYNEQDVAQLKRFDVNAQQKQVDEILDHIFKNTPYQCAYESDVIYITPRPVGDLPQVKQERVKLSGNIKDKNGNVLPGVTVFIGNSDIGTSSDINGNYQLAILKGNAVEIVYSFIGMKKVTYNFPATEDVRHNVVMEEDQVELQDVVVIGYGSKSARNLTSSVSSVKAKDLEKYANGATTFDNMLGGAVKGVLVNQNSGEPYGVLDAIRAEGRRVPEDYSVCGFDNIFPSQFLPVGLTTVEHYIADKGRNAFEILHSKMSGESSDRNITRVEFKHHLIVRDSTAAPRGEEKTG